MEYGNIIQPIGTPTITYQGKIIQVVHQDMQKGNKKKTFEYAERAPGVRILIIDDTENICLTRERRTELNEGQGGWDYRLPGGKVFDTLEEYNAFRDKSGNIVDAAMKAVGWEAKEEVGIIPEHINHIHTSGCGATMHWDLYYFLVDKFSQDPTGQDLGFSEHIEVFRFSFDEVKQKCLDGSIDEDRTVAVLMRYIMN